MACCSARPLSHKISRDVHMYNAAFTNQTLRSRTNITFCSSSLSLSGHPMACCPTNPLSHATPFAFTSVGPHLAKTRFKTTKCVLNRSASRSLSATTLTSNPITTTTFTWDDVVRISNPGYALDDSSDLSGFFDKVKVCNRGVEKKSEFVPFVIDGQIVGYLHNGFVEHLRNYQDVFVLPQRINGSQIGNHVTLNPELKTPDDRTRAVGEVIGSLGEDIIPGIRNELYPVTSSYGASVFFSLERAAAPYFGIKAYAIHLNGFEERDGQQFLWTAKRSRVKPTYPGMLDHLVAGGLPHGIACGENLLKECEEEAGIPRSISRRAIPVGGVSYMNIDGHRYERDVLFCYDLKLPQGFMPNNQDDEVESFKLIPVTHVADIVRRTNLFKPSCCLVIIDFLFRHGYIIPEHSGYLDLLQSLRSGECS
ncbi:nudix hydrolase 20 chloroplastic-like [Tripterygium wilfordii]|uniref:Nudix hydrolase 20 chloroplastic-like n=1 Tax=Tripterygium wilfordii TaxID=458696 RepID=A0A7J7DR76_TRIWF|nr:nudix hydrolase 20, chloroplastic-like [Tripterygium wilfordii]KAF5748616.1 nudix hydrolase 20 chloroplastic-like [Tripterygium wilfordii]